MRAAMQVGVSVIVRMTMMPAVAQVAGPSRRATLTPRDPPAHGRAA
jgi:hypothetical protein